MAVDAQIMGVVGHWLEATTQAAAPEYARAGLPLLATAAGPLPAEAYRLWPAASCHLALAAGCAEAVEDLRLSAAEGVTVTAPAPLPEDSTDPGFADRYRAISGGVEPRFNAVLAYDAARLLLEALARDIQANRTPTRTGVGAALAASAWPGLSGRISFDAARQWSAPRLWTYRWQSGELVQP
jgi:ABC-type branched-subunit amino acid transport system substrate-binding protein